MLLTGKGSNGLTERLKDLKGFKDGGGVVGVGHTGSSRAVFPSLLYSRDHILVEPSAEEL